MRDIFRSSGPNAQRVGYVMSAVRNTAIAASAEGLFRRFPPGSLQESRACTSRFDALASL